MEVFPKVPGGGLEARAEERDEGREVQIWTKGVGGPGRGEAEEGKISIRLDQLYIYNFYSYMHVSQVCSMYLYIRTGNFMHPDLALTFATVLYHRDNRPNFGIFP